MLDSHCGVGTILLPLPPLQAMIFRHFLPRFSSPSRESDPNVDSDLKEGTFYLYFRGGDPDVTPKSLCVAHTLTQRLTQERLVREC